MVQVSEKDMIYKNRSDWMDAVGIRKRSSALVGENKWFRNVMEKRDEGGVRWRHGMKSLPVRYTVPEEHIDDWSN